MSATSTVLTDQHFRYLAERTAGEDDFIRELKTAATKAELPAIWIAPEQASFMQILLKAAGVKEVVEVGTLAGSTAITLARALPADGRVRTIEVNPAHAAFARAWTAKSDVADRIEVIEGSGREILPTMPEASVDALFLDADKVSYSIYLAEGLRLVKTGGLVLVDNAFAFGKLLDPSANTAEVDAVRAFNELMARQNRLQSVIVPLGDGLWVGVKTA